MAIEIGEFNCCFQWNAVGTFSQVNANSSESLAIKCC